MIPSSGTSANRMSGDGNRPSAASSTGRELPYHNLDPVFFDFSRNHPKAAYAAEIFYALFMLFVSLIYLLVPSLSLPLRILAAHGVLFGVIRQVMLRRVTISQGVITSSRLKVFKPLNATDREQAALLITGDQERPLFRLILCGVAASAALSASISGYLAGYTSWTLDGFLSFLSLRPWNSRLIGIESAQLVVAGFIAGLCFVFVLLIRVPGGYTETGYSLTPSHIRFRARGLEWVVAWEDIVDVRVGYWNEGPEIITVEDGVVNRYFKRKWAGAERKRMSRVEMPTSETCLRPNEMVAVIRNFLTSPWERGHLGTSVGEVIVARTIERERADGRGPKPPTRRP